MAKGEESQKKQRFPKKILTIVVVLVGLLLIGTGTYLYLEYKKSQDLINNPTLAAQVELETLVTKVGKLMELPKGEQPTIATVSDITKLQGQPFFAKAKNGYKVLIYAKAKKAILYDPVDNKIVEVGPVNPSEQSQTPASPTPSAPVKVALYNGTTVNGLATTVEKQLTDSGANITVVEKANAGKSDYTQTVVIDLTGKNAAMASELAKTLGGTTGSLPEGEAKPQDAEILIILGQ